MTPNEYVGLSASDIASKVADGSYRAREITDIALARIAATEPQVNAFIHIDDQGARAAADALDRSMASGVPPGPLAGVPISVKDLVHVAGMPTSGGSKVFAGTMAPGDATPVARLRAAGAIIVGKTTTPEFGHKPITSSPLFGQTLNPWNRQYTSGGSSGGAAVSVATGQVPLAIGTDGGGSIRIPASVCGVYGLKATLGQIAHIHAADLYGNNSFIGPITRTIDDLKLMYEVMAGGDTRDPWSRRDPNPANIEPSDKLRIGWALTVGNPAVEEAVVQAFESAVRAASKLGMKTEPVDLNFAKREPAFRTHLESVLAARFAPYLDQNRARFDPSFIKTIENGLHHSGTDVVAATAVRTELYREIESLFETIDFLITPTVAAASLPFDTDSHADTIIGGKSCGPIRGAWYPYTFPFNLTGHPALSMPCGWTEDNLPIGLQIVGPWDEDAGIIALAQSLSNVLAFERRLP